LLDRAAGTMVHKKLSRISPLAVPVMAIVGRETVAQGASDDRILFEAEALAATAMQSDTSDTTQLPRA
jgi:ATP-dependent Lhr-like helicase